MNAKLIAGLVLAVVVVLYLVVSAAPATPPLQYDATAKDRSSPMSQGGGAAAGDDARAVKALRSELDQIRALIKSNANGNANGASGDSTALGGVPKSAAKCAACPPCHECIERKCPPCAAPTPAASAAAAPAPSAASGSNALIAAARCKKFPMDLPPNIKRLTLQVGPHLSPLNSQGDDHAVISFEPQLKVAHANTEKRMKNTYQVPAAISSYDGLAMFDMADDHQQSASLNSFNPKIASWSGQKVFVPVMRLDTVLECLSAERFPYIEYFLCDAQGSDLDVMKSAGAHLKRFRRVEMEVQVNKFSYYQSDNSKANAVAYMQTMGFRVESSHCNGVDAATIARDPTICEEENVVFVPA